MLFAAISSEKATNFWPVSALITNLIHGVGISDLQKVCEPEVEEWTHIDDRTAQIRAQASHGPPIGYRADKLFVSRSRAASGPAGGPSGSKRARRRRPTASRSRRSRDRRAGSVRNPHSPGPRSPGAPGCA